MQNIEFLEQLEQYRAEIDAIDADILHNLAKRFEVVAQVGALKAKHDLRGSYIRPAREALMLRKLLDDAKQIGVPQSLVAGLWRLIIGASTGHESPLNVVHLSDDVHGAFAAAQYFSDMVPQYATNMANFWNCESANQHSIFILPYQLDNPLWQLMPAYLKIFACLPFVGGDNIKSGAGAKPTYLANAKPTYLAIANIHPEPTGDDISLFHDGDKLIEVNGFMQQYQDNIAKDYIFVGAYANMFIIND